MNWKTGASSLAADSRRGSRTHSGADELVEQLSAVGALEQTREVEGGRERERETSTREDSIDARRSPSASMNELVQLRA